MGILECRGRVEGEYPMPSDVTYTQISSFRYTKLEAHKGPTLYGPTPNLEPIIISKAIIAEIFNKLQELVSSYTEPGKLFLLHWPVKSQCLKMARFLLFFLVVASWTFLILIPGSCQHGSREGLKTF